LREKGYVDMAKCNGPRKCKGFRTFKERGEWVELQFMAWALRKGFTVTKPWGDSSSYDVGVEHGRQFLRVQIKSSSYRTGNGYMCGFAPNQRRKRYARRKIDFFAGYIIPEDIWYVIPATVVLRTKSANLVLCPLQPMRRDCYKYESYRDAWKLLRSRKRKQTPSHLSS
jgi:hypothetical protein